MKTFSLCILAAAFVCLWAAPAWYDLLPATNLEKEWNELLPPTELENGVLIKGIWSDCSKKSDPMKLIKVQIKPDQPKQGQNFTIIATIEMDEVITGGEIEFSVYYRITPIFSKTLNLCAGMESFGLTCPISAGTYQNSTRIYIPFGLAKGHYTGTGKMFDQNKQELLCVRFDLALVTLSV